MEVFKFKILQTGKRLIPINTFSASSIKEAEDHVIGLLTGYVNNAFEPAAETKYAKVYLEKNEEERSFRLIIGGAFSFFVQILKETKKETH
jgi:hypothetical protein